MYASESCDIRYAVVEARWFGRNAERFALEYSSEESLRELVAGPSIVATGFSSRKEALTLIPDSAAVAMDATRRADAIGELRELRSNPDDGPSQWHSQVPQQTWMTPGHLVQQLAAMFVVIVCSKNLLSAAVRAFIGL